MKQALKLGSLVGAYAVTSVGDYHGYPTGPKLCKRCQETGVSKDE